MFLLFYFWILIQVVIGFNLLFPLGLLMLRTIRKLFIKVEKTDEAMQPVKRDYAIVVTAYLYTDFISSAVESLLQLNYSNYIIYVVADNCDTTGLHFDSDKVVLLKPKYALGANVRSHLHAIDNFIRPHTHITIIDCDNTTHPEYLNQLNVCFDNGFQAVQGLRAAKNLDTNYACLDAARDIYYHFYDGKILFESGSSATLSGSGMAFKIDFYSEAFKTYRPGGAGFDKVLQFNIVKLKLRIAFNEHAIVYDAKTTHAEQLVNQRARWINSWFRFFKYGFTLIGRGVANFSWKQFIFGVVLLRPPLFMFLLGSVLFFLINCIVSPIIAGVWLLAMICFVVSFGISLVSSNTDKRVYASLKNIPRFIFYQLVSLWNMRKANKLSVATKHTS